MSYVVWCDNDDGLDGYMTDETAAEMVQEATTELKEEIERLKALINTPHVESFLEAVKLEAIHQQERWGKAHDRNKSAENWFWLVGYLAGKALRANIDGNREKALHHTISSAAALLHWHHAICNDDSGFGIGTDEDLTRDFPDLQESPG